MMRPRAACWFEAVAARADATRVLEALAATGAVELEAEPDCAPLAEWRELAPGLAEYAALAARYAQHWPAAAASGPCPQAPLDMLTEGLQALNRWVQQCEPLLAQLHTLAEHEQARRVGCRRCKTGNRRPNWCRRNCTAQGPCWPAACCRTPHRPRAVCCE